MQQQIEALLVRCENNYNLYLISPANLKGFIIVHKLVIIIDVRYAAVLEFNHLAWSDNNLNLHSKF